MKKAYVRAVATAHPIILKGKVKIDAMTRNAKIATRTDKI